MQPHDLTDDVVARLLEQIWRYRECIDVRKIIPRVK
jgi:hypothetical protein